MKQTIALLSRKGGAGKSSTVSAIAAGLNKRGYRVLVCDVDGQANTSYIMRAADGPTLYDVLIGAAPVSEAIQHAETGDIIPASQELDMSEVRMTGEKREFRLKEALETVKDSYDFIVLDTAPAFGVLTINALAAASGVVIPVQADVWSLTGLQQIGELVGATRRSINPSLAVYGLLLTRFNSRSVLSRDLTEAFNKAAAQMGTRLFSASIREGVSVKEAQVRRQDLFSYAPNSNPAKDYSAFVDELLTVLGEKGA